MSLNKCPKCKRAPMWDYALTYGENGAGIVGKYIILMCRCTKMKTLVPSVRGNMRANISRLSAAMKNMEKQWNALFPEKEERT